MSLAFRPLVSVLVVALMAPMAFANNNNQAVTSSLSVQAPKREGSRWSGFMNVSRSASANDFQDGTRRDSMDYMGRANYKLNESFSLRGQAGYSQDLRNPESDDFSDTSFQLHRKAVDFGRNFQVGYRLGATAPTSKDSSKRQNLITSLSSAVNIGINPARLISGLSIQGSMSLARNIHTYETALDGRVNTQYSSTQALSLGYGFSNGISLSADFSHRNSWSYQNVMRDSFEMSQEIGYSINPTWSVALGHTNSGATLKPNGQDSDVSLYDENTSMLYGSLTLLF